jgi:hypothetical protein
VDIDKLIARVKAILTTPKTEWPVIAAEPATVPDLYKNYIAIVAAIPVIATFIKGSLIGYGAFGINYRTPIGTGIAAAVVGYALSLALAYVMALIIDALAPTFGGQKNPVQALKTVAYAWTASWIASIGQIVPWLGWLIAIAGMVYSIYLLYLGLPVTMKAPQEKAGGYTAVSIIIAIVLGWIIAIVVGGIIGTAGLGAAALGGAHGSAGQVTIDKDSPLAQVDAWSKKMEAAGKQMEAAQKSGDAEAQTKALGAIVGAATGGQVESLAPDVLKPFVPETLAGLKRTQVSAERNGAMGMQVSTAHASYASDDGSRLELEITDLGSAKGLMGLAGLANVEADKQTDHGYDKTYKRDGRLIHEEWDTRNKHGEYSIVLGERFSVKVSGHAESIDQIKSAVAGLNLAGLEALKDQGVKKG